MRALRLRANSTSLSLLAHLPVSAILNIGDLTRRVARGSGIVFAGQIAGKVIGVFLQITLSRGLGKALYGTYALAISLMKILQAVGGLGLQGGVVRFSAEAQGQGEVGRVRGTLLATLAIGTATSIVIGVGLFLTSEWWAQVVFQDELLIPILRAFAIALPFYVLTFLTAQAARGLQSMLADVSIGIVAQPFVNLVAVSIAFLLGYTLDGAIAAFVLSSVASGILGVWVLSRIFRPLWSGVSARFDVRRLLRYSLPVMGVGLTALFVDQADRVMIGILASTSDVGVYTIAALLATQVRFVLSAVSATFTPIISDLYHGDRRDELHRLFKITTRWIVMLSLPLAIVLAMFPTPFLRVFGPEFMEGAPVVLVLSIGSFLNGATGTIGLMLQMSDYERVVLLDNVAVAILNVGLNLWLIPIYGPLGAAIATAVSVTLINAAQVMQVWSRLGMTPFDADLFRPMAAGCIAAVAGWGIAEITAFSLNPPWMLDAVAGIAATGMVYLGAVVAIGLPREDWTVLTPILRRTGLDRFISSEEEP